MILHRTPNMNLPGTNKIIADLLHSVRKIVKVYVHSLHLFIHNVKKSGLIKNPQGSYLSFLPRFWVFFLQIWKLVYSLVLLFIVWSKRAIANCKVSKNLCSWEKMAHRKRSTKGTIYFGIKVALSIVNTMSWRTNKWLYVKYN